MAIGALCGVDPSNFLRADHIEQALLTRIINEAQVKRQEFSQELAGLIITELGKALKRGKNKRG